MADSIIDDLSDLMASSVTVQPWLSQNGMGEDVYGPAIIVPGRLRSGNKLVKSASGKEVVSKVTFWAEGIFGLTTEDLFTLPAPWKPTSPAAIVVDIVTDENGPHHEKVMF